MDDRRPAISARPGARSTSQTRPRSAPSRGCPAAGTPPTPARGSQSSSLGTKATIGRHGGSGSRRAAKRQGGSAVSSAGLALVGLLCATDGALDTGALFGHSRHRSGAQRRGLVLGADAAVPSNAAAPAASPASASAGGANPAVGGAQPTFIDTSNASASAAVETTAAAEDVTGPSPSMPAASLAPASSEPALETTPAEPVTQPTIDIVPASTEEAAVPTQDTAAPVPSPPAQASEDALPTPNTDPLPAPDPTPTAANDNDVPLSRGGGNVAESTEASPSMTMDPQPSQASDLPAESNTVLPSAMTEPLPPAPTATMDDEKPGKPVPTNGAIVASTEAPSLPADGVVTRPPPNVVQSTFPAPTLKPATYTERPVPEDGGGDFPADPDATGSGEVPFQTATLVPVPVPPPARPTQMTDLLSSKASQAAGQPTGRPVGPVGPGDDIPIVPGNGANNNGANNNGAANNNAGDAAAESSSGPGKFIVVVPTEIADPTDPAAWDPNAPPASKPSRVRIPGQTYDSSDPYAIESAGGSTISNGPTVTIVLSMVGVAVVTVVVVLGILFWRKRHRKAEGRRVMLNESFGRMNRSKSDKSKGSRGPDDGDAPEMVEVSGENADEESVERDAREDVLAAFEDALGDETEGPFENKAGRGRKPPPPRIQTAQMVQRTNSYGPSIQFSSGSSGLQSMAEFSSGSSPTTLTNGYKSPSSAAGKKKVVTFMDSLIKPASAPVVQAPPRAALLQRTMSASAANGKGLVSSPALTKSASMGSRILHSSPLVMSSAASVMSDSTYDDDGCSVFSGMSGPMSIRNVQLEQGGRTLVALSAGVNRGRLELVVDEDASDASSDEEATAWEEPTANLVRKEPGRLVLHQVPTTIARSSPTLNATEVNRAASMEL